MSGLRPAAFELGLPAYRIGVSVLSDFSLHCGDELPVGFWNTYWASYIGLGAHPPTDESTKTQQMAAQNVAKLIYAHRLQYLTDSGIVLGFLEQEGDDAKDGDR
jgi:hypothetical protein